MALLEHWTEWMDRCALGLCAPASRQSLQQFAASRFSRFAHAYATRTSAGNPRQLTPPPPDAWHLFETHLRLRNTRSGKSYKQWLLARTASAGGQALDVIQGGATLIMRDVVRDALRREYAPRWMGSLNRPCGEPGAPTLEELIPSSTCTTASVEDREMSAMAVTGAERIFSGLSRRQRIALLARECGLSLSSPRAIHAAGCRKSVLYDAFLTALKTTADATRAQHPGERQDFLADLAIRTLAQLRRLALTWGRSEIGLRRFFFPDEETTA